jgi:hypothetical protein
MVISNDRQRNTRDRGLFHPSLQKCINSRKVVCVLSKNESTAPKGAKTPE